MAVPAAAKADPLPEAGDATLSWGAILTALGGGLALFLYGIRKLTDALGTVAGEGMKTLLERLTTNRFTAAAAGAMVTAVIQSSSVTTVLVVGFVSAGLMNLTQSVGVIMGANIGTTITAQVIAFKVTKYALLLVAIGFAPLFLSRRDRVRQIGAVLFGLGLIFLGMDLMSGAMAPLRVHDPFVEASSALQNPWLALGAGAAFTALVQSSSATTGIVIVLAGQGLLPLETGIALVLGSNVGTCVTAVLATLGRSRPALQVAAVHVLFNVVGALIWLPFVDAFADLVRQISPAAADLAGAERLAAETPRQIANAHTLFNAVNVVLLIGAAGPIARLVVRVLPERPGPEADRARPIYLDDAFLTTPAFAIDRLRRETARLGELVRSGFAQVAGRRRPFPLVELGRIGDDSTRLHEAILDYARKILARGLSAIETERVTRALDAGQDFAGIADSLRLNLQALGREWRARGVEASEETRRRLADLHDLVLTSIDDAIVAVRDEDTGAAARLIGRKRSIVEAADRLAQHLARRLPAGDDQRLAVHRLEASLIEFLKRVYYFAKRAAKAYATPIDDPETLPRSLGAPVSGELADGEAASGPAAPGPDAT